MRIRTLLLPALLAAVLPATAQDTYRIDAVHSQVGFRIRHVVAKVSGRFAKFDGVIKVDTKDASKSSVEVTIDAASISTDNDARDKHLKGADFFEVEKFPSITFKSTAVKEVAKGKLEVTGNLTIKGVTKTVTFPITNAGTHEAKPGKVLAGFVDGSLKINRNDYGIKYGPGILGDEVEITLDVEAGKQ